MRTLYVESSCCLDVAVYMLNCVFWWNILLEIKSLKIAATWAQTTMHSGITHER